MLPANREFLDLISNIELYLFQEYSSQAWICVSRESHLEYRAFAAQLNDYGKPTKISPPQNIPKEISPAPIKPKVQESQTKESISQSLGTEEAKPEFKIQKIENPIPAVSKPHKEEGIKKNIPDFSDLQKIIQQHLPHQVILSSVPEDSLAKKMKGGKKETILFFYVKNLQDKQALFLSNLCKAVKIVYGVKADIVDKPIPLNEKQHLLELPDVEIYIREPKQKVTLWKTIESLLKPLLNS